MFQNTLKEDIVFFNDLIRKTVNNNQRRELEYGKNCFNYIYQKIIKIIIKINKYIYYCKLKIKKLKRINL